MHVLGTLLIPRSGRVLITDPGYEIKVGELLKYPDGLWMHVWGVQGALYPTRQRTRDLDSLRIFHTHHKTVQPKEMTDCVFASDCASMFFWMPTTRFLWILDRQLRTLWLAYDYLWIGGLAGYPCRVW
jgi:hypothetical protein